jgi:heme A synthase
LTGLERESKEVNAGHGPDRKLFAAVAGTAAATYALVVLGSTVRVTGSGMGCPDWPLCHGQLGPAGGVHTLLEQSHRYLVVLVTLLVVGTAGWARWRSRRRPDVIRLLTFAVAALAVQAVLGAVTVWTKNAPLTVAAHLAVAMVLLALLVAAAVRAGTSWSEARRDRLAWTAVTATFVVVLSGAVVADAGADTACPSWPLCAGRAGPARLVALQLAHRGIVAVTVAALIALALRCWPRDHGLSLALLILLTAQVAAGALVVVGGATAWAEDLHLALAAALWCVVVALVARGRRIRAPMGTTSPPGNP